MPGRAVALTITAGDSLCADVAMKAALLLTISMMTSCVGPTEVTTNKLLGEWRYADAVQSCEYFFKKDGTFRGEVVYQAKVLSRFEGRWSVHGDAIFYEYTGDGLGRIPNGTKDKDKLLAVEDDYFLIRAADGSERKYVRRNNLRLVR